MQMIPPTPHRTHSSAELRVFDRLKAAYRQDDKLQLMAFHSLNLTHHAYKRFGEIDFLIVGRPGIFVLEVKGGGVACHNGFWEYTDRAGQGHTSPEGPFRQAQSALHGLMSKLQNRFPESIWSQFTIGYAVVFPDCDWMIAGTEWDPEMLADMRTSRNLERWLSGLFAYWRRKDPRQRREPDDDALAAVKRFLRPEFDVAVPLHVHVEEVERQVVSLTEDQMWMVDVAEANPRLLCSGGAGTGKTFLALELARRWAAMGLKVLLTCRSAWLRHWLATRFAIPGIAVSIADAAPLAARRLAIDRFDALIVDEGQDLLNLVTLDRLDGILVGGLERGRWCFFHDINNQAGYVDSPHPDALDRLTSYGPVLVPLKTNCRNTRQILELVQASLGADMGVRGTGNGPQVRLCRVKSKPEAARILQVELERLINHGGLQPDAISILSPRPFPDSAAALLPAGPNSPILVLDEYSMRHFPPPGISFAEIAHFKGLENEAVVVIDLADPLTDPSPGTEHYVGMSRARTLLSLIYSEP
ncbi:nuclease-related domain-containing DEAD/DEAH box helicase [Lamprocystis purpurea]|jgi:hypothetical protein|uniref:nuclease-related domain-containing DEAD/DEAH box helicase n=1 Tax=Lamprocystis purpurea TaxID=61598 RepID=UPI00036063ED|nr:NERD domain-containing protein [Lamprocystis purpurea]